MATLERMPRVNGRLGFDWSSVPIIGGVVTWTQNQANEAASWLVAKYAEYVRAKQQLNAMSADYARAQEVAVNDPAVRPLVAKWGDALRGAATKLNAGDYAVNQVISWYNSATGQRGMGAFPGVPVAIIGVLAFAIYTVKEVVSRVSDAQRVEALVKAGMTPDQIARVFRATSGTNRVTSFFANLGVVGTLALVGVGAFLVVPQLRKAVRS